MSDEVSARRAGRRYSPPSKPCLECGTLLLPSWKFCPNCGLGARAYAYDADGKRVIVDPASPFDVRIVEKR